RGVVVDGREPTGEDVAAARAAVDAADVAIVGTRSARLFAPQADFVAAVLGWSKPVVAVALNEPYDLLAYPAAPTALATYGATPEMLDALAAVLAGEEAPRGRLPAGRRSTCCRRRPTRVSTSRSTASTASGRRRRRSNWPGSTSC